MKAATEVPLVNRTAPTAASGLCSRIPSRAGGCSAALPLGPQPHGRSVSRRTLRRSRVQSVPSHPGGAGVGLGHSCRSAGTEQQQLCLQRGSRRRAERKKTTQMRRRATRRSSCQSCIGAGGLGSRRLWHLASRGWDGNNCRSSNNNYVKTKIKRVLFKGIHVCLQLRCFLK